MKRIVFVAVFSLFFASFYTYGQELVGSYWNGKYGFKDKKTGTIVVSHKYDWASWNFHEGLAAVRLKRKFGFINYNGTVAIPIRYDAALNFSEGLASVKLKGKYGFIDRTGAVVIHFNYDDAKQFSEGLAAIKQNGKYGFIDKTGNVVIPCIYDIAEKFSEGKTAVKLNGRWGFIDKTGAVVIPIAYASMFAAEDWKSNKAIAGVNTTSVARNTNTRVSQQTNVSPSKNVSNNNVIEPKKDSISEISSKQGKFAIEVKGLFGYYKKYDEYGIGIKLSYNITQPIRLAGEFNTLSGYKTTTNILGINVVNLSSWNEFSLYAHYLIPSGEGLLYPLIGVGIVEYNEKSFWIWSKRSFYPKKTVISLGFGCEYSLFSSKNFFVTSEMRLKIIKIEDVSFHIVGGLAYRF